MRNAENEKSIIGLRYSLAHGVAQAQKVLCSVVAGFGLLFVPGAFAAGTLTPVGAAQQPIQIRDHHVSVVINNGFAQTEVTQTFFNPNAQDQEAIYAFPIPKSASLSEFVIYAGEQEIKGEVVAKEKAEQVYEEEKKSGNDAGLARKNSYQTFEFRVARVPTQQETRIRFLYYQPLEVDSGVGRFVYPLEDGGTDEVAKSFWTANAKVENTFSAQIDVRMASPIDDVRVPGFEQVAAVERVDAGHQRIKLAATNAALSKDLVVYYRLAQNLPGRIELLPYRPDPTKPGSFMLIVTPGLDLKPITSGADYVFVLDVSGSMTDKIATLANGVKQSLQKLRPEDRFRIVTFSENASELTHGWQNGNLAEVNAAIAAVEQLRSQNSTNLYAGLELGLKGLDADRVSSLVLVTDGVTNTGTLEPKEFAALLKKYDVRVFGFLMGNSSNWPLLEVITKESGGFYAAISNSDDIVGQLLLAKSKITSEALHDVALSVSGVRVSDSTEANFRKIYRGQQFAIFGHYDAEGDAVVKVKAHLSGEDKEYSTTLHFPEKDTHYPEVERLWAMSQIEALKRRTMLGALNESEMKDAEKSIGVTYQLVTDETSMLVLSDEGFRRHQIDRNNMARTSTEHQAQAYRMTQPVRNNTAPQSTSMWGNSYAPHISSGGGAIDPLSALLLFGFLGGAGALSRRRRVER